MTAINRVITPRTLSNVHKLANITRTQNLYGLAGLSKDRTIVFGTSGVGLYQSTDDAITFTLIHSFSSAVSGIIELADGECLVLVKASSSTVYRSTGWSTNKFTATWAVSYTFQGDTVPAQWSFTPRNAGSNGVVVTGTYGGKTTTGAATLTANINAGCRVFLSQDFGVTFTKIWDLLESNNGSNGCPAPSSNGNHVHCVTYDEEWDRIWISYGDDIGNGYLVSGNNRMQLVYSDDRGVTWNTMPLPTDYSTGSGGGFQFTTIYCTHDNVILLPDGSPYAVTTFPKIGYRQLGTYRVGPHLVVGDGQGGSASNGNNGIIGQNVFQAIGSNMPIFCGYNQFGSGGGTLQPARLMASSNNGQDWYELLYYPSGPSTDVSMTISMIGPTASGKVLGNHSYKGPSSTWTSSLIRADLINPP